MAVYTQYQVPTLYANIAIVFGVGSISIMDCSSTDIGFQNRFFFDNNSQIS